MDRAKAKGKAAEVGAEVEVVPVLEVNHDHALDPAPIDPGIAVEAEAVPAAQGVADVPDQRHRGVLALPRAPKAGQRNLVGTQRQRLYAVHTSRTNVEPRSAHISTMAHVGSTRKVTAKRARTVSSNTLMNLETLRGAPRIDQNHQTKLGRKARRTAKRKTDPIPPLQEGEARIRRIKKTKRVKRSLLLGHPKVAAEDKVEIRTKLMPRSLLRDQLWSSKGK